jgi:predicted TIM-barrel fold metal-dependent hydrolase
MIIIYGGTPLKKIAIEEHFHGSYYQDYVQYRKGYPRLEFNRDESGQEVWRWWGNEGEYQLWKPRTVARMRDIGEERIKDMDAAGVDMQLLSFTPGIDDFVPEEGTEISRNVNNNLAEAVQKYPNRFAGLAALAMKSPDKASQELERAVKDLGLKGAMIFPHIDGEYIDDKKYRPVFSMAAKLDVPLYIHPIYPSPKNKHLFSGYPELAGAMWGFAVETISGVMRLICSGLFDEFPGLKIILGHMGEAFPFWMSRLDNRLQHSSVTLVRLDSRGKAQPAPVPLVKTLKKLPSQYLRDNFYMTMSGMLWTPALVCTILALGTDRILFAVDYPMEPSREAVQYLETAPLSNYDKEKIFHLNAEALLKL